MGFIWGVEYEDNNVANPTPETIPQSNHGGTAPLLGWFMCQNGGPQHPSDWFSCSRGQRRFLETSKSRLSDIEDLKKLNHMRERGPTKPSKSLRHRLGHFCCGGRPSICQVNGTRPQTLGTWRLGARNIWKWRRKIQWNSSVWMVCLSH